MQNKESSILGTLLTICLLQAMVVLLAGLNLYLSWSNYPLTELLQVRWREIISLLVVTPTSMILLFSVHRILENNRKDALIPLFVLILGSCWLAISMGIHEPINIFRQQTNNLTASSARVLWFWDDVFSHIVFFAGYASTSISILWSQKRNPLKKPMSLLTVVLFMICGMIGGLGITYSLVPCPTVTIDLSIILGVLIIAEIMRKGQPFKERPLNIVMEVSCLLPLIMLARKIFMR